MSNETIKTQRKSKPQLTEHWKINIDLITTRVFFRLVSLFVWWILLLGLAISSALNFFQVGWDDTDGIKTRSNLESLIDYGTGCEYLRSSNGGLTPRLDPQGKHMCGSVEEL